MFKQLKTLSHFGMIFVLALGCTRGLRLKNSELSQSSESENQSRMVVFPSASAPAVTLSHVKTVLIQNSTVQTNSIFRAITLSEIPAATKWCISAQQTARPASASDICSGGTGADKGWVSEVAGKVEITFSSEQALVYVWMAVSSIVDSNYTIAIETKDEAGTPSTPVVRNFVVDTTIPVVMINMGPAAMTNQTTVQFLFSAIDGGSGLAGFMCSIDGGAFSVCLSPMDYTGLKAGPHTFAVKALDFAQNSSATVSHSWQINPASPSLLLSMVTANPSKNAAVQFTFSATDSGQTLTGFECRIDGGAYTTNCKSPLTTAALTSGTHTFGVRVQDLSGAMTAEQKMTFDVDLVTPTVTITAPNMYYTTKTVSVQFVAADNTANTLSLRCRLDQLAFGNCTSATTYVIPSTVTEATHSASVEATDKAGNITMTTSSDFTVDITTPTVTNLVSPTNCTVGSCTNTLSWQSSDVTSGLNTTTCAVNANAAQSCTSPFTIVSGLTATGLQTIILKVADKAGNSNTQTKTWTISAVGGTTPTPTPTAPPTAPPSGSNARMMLTQNDFVFLGGFRVADDFRLSSGVAFRRTPAGKATILLGGDATEYVIPSTLGTGDWSSWPTVTSSRNFVSSWNGKNFFQPVVPGSNKGTVDYINSLFWDSTGTRLYATILGDGYYTGSSGSAEASTLVVADLDTATDTVRGTAAYSLNGVGFKRLNKCVMAIPQWYASLYLNGQRLGLGCGGYQSIISYGDVSLGPAIRAIAPPTQPHLARLSSSEVLYFPDSSGGQAARPSTGVWAYTADASIGARNDGTWQWSEIIAQGALWIDTDTKHGLLMITRFGVGPLMYHQSGGFSTSMAFAWQLYNPLDFAPASKKSAWSPRPTSTWNPTLPGVADPGDEGQGLYLPSLTWDPVTRRLYIAQAAPGAGFYPQSKLTIYVFQVQ